MPHDDDKPTLNWSATPATLAEDAPTHEWPSPGAAADTTRESDGTDTIAADVRVDHFHVLREIGRGGMGEVWDEVPTDWEGGRSVVREPPAGLPCQRRR